MGWQDGTVVEEQAPAWASGALVEPHAGHGVLDAIKAGYQGSATGLILRGKLPDVVLDAQHAKWYEKALAGASQMISEMPEMIAGAVGVGAAGTAAGGPVGGILGAGAGSFAVPAAIRTAYMEALTKGQVTSSADFLTRAGIVIKQTAKEGAVGALTAGAGAAVARGVGAVVAPAVGTSLSVPAATRLISGAEQVASVGTMVVAPAALEGRMPEPEDFLNAAILVGGMKAAGAVAGRIRQTWARTGVKPEQVAADAVRDPKLKEELTKPQSEGVPAPYKPLADAETVANAMPDPKKLDAVLSNIGAPIPDSKTPGHINYRYVEDADGLHAIFAAGSAAFEKAISEQRNAPKGWDQSLAEARATLAQAQGRKVSEIPHGNTALDAQMLMHNSMLIDAAADLKAAMTRVKAAGANVTEADARSQILAAQNLESVLSFTLGKNAEVARALNVLKATKQMTALASDMAELRAKYGTDPQLFARMGLAMETPGQLAKFIGNATMWEKSVEAWKAGILSGPVTHLANVIGNTTFMALRPAVDAVAAAFGRLQSPEDRVSAAEPMARIIGNLQGAKDALTVAGTALRTAYEEGGIKGLAKEIAVGKETATKAEQFRPAIQGTKGDVIRLPFRALQLADDFFRTLNERGEAYALAAREAVKQGLNPATREFREFVVDTVQNPSVEIAIASKAAAERFTFNTPLGDFGQKVSAAIRAPWFGTQVAPLQVIVPFIRTPLNIVEELGRMTVFAPLVKGWREAFAAGGAERAKAMAELSMGTAISAVAMSYVMDGSISGQGTPDPGKKRVAMAAGWQPYSWKVGDTWYSYQRLQPVGTLIGLAADMGEIWDHMTEQEQDKIPKMIAVAFANSVTNQTFLQGITNVVNSLSDPKRFVPRFAQSMAGSVVPNIVGQTVTMNDPVVREVNSMLDAIKARVPGLRETLMPKRDVFGEEMKTRERLGVVSPVTETTESDDKVRTEAVRLGVSASDAPKKVHVGRGTGKIGDVEITPEQRNRFTEVSGKLAHQVLVPIVSAPTWDSLPDLVKKRIYQRVFTIAHKQAAIQTFPPEQRAALVGSITEKLEAELSPQ